jgi:hypothetical protein
MQYRQFFHNGKPTDRIDSADGEFATRPEVGIAEVADVLGVPPAEVTVVVTTTRPTQVEVVMPPAPAEDVKPPVTRILEAIATARDLAELKRAVADIK